MSVEVGDIIEFMGWERIRYEVLKLSKSSNEIVKLRNIIDTRLEYSGSWRFEQVRVINSPKFLSVENLEEYEGIFE